MILGVIGGTGIDEMPEFASGRVIAVNTRFGEAHVVRDEQASKGVLFLPRHGLKHNAPPSQINYRAQMAALKKLRVTRAIGVCAVGSLSATIAPGSFVVMGDFIDLTRHRPSTFFDDPCGPVVHTDFTEPYCPVVSKALLEACLAAGISAHPRAVYVGVDGPRYESPAEIKLYARWGGDVIGMTNLPEVVLAREAGICYGTLGLVTNLAAGLGIEPLVHNDVRASVAAMRPKLQAVLNKALSILEKPEECGCALNSSLDL